MKASPPIRNTFIQAALTVSTTDGLISKASANQCVIKTTGDSFVSANTQANHDNQLAYNFLHRSPHRHSDLGGYGEDFGFHYPPRVFVDPDSPHIYPFYNRWHQCGNLRESRYSHHRRMLQSVDVAKLIRHGRLLPLPHRLLNDYLMSKIPLRDCDCSAFFDYAHSVLIKANAGDRGTAGEDAYFTHIVDMFERLLATKLPPSEVGPKTHAAVIRCCAHVRKFQEGYEWFRGRARSTAIDHTIELYDSIIELCEKCGENDAAWVEFDALLREHRRVPPITLCRMLRVAASQGNYQKGREVWELFDFYHHAKNGNAYEAGLEWLSECTGKGREALSMITEMRQAADKAHVESLYSSKGSAPADGTYDRFSSRIIHNNQGPNSSGISIFNAENFSYSNNQSVAEYEAKGFLRSLHPTVGMVLNVLYCLVTTDSETYKLAWNLYQEEFLDEKASASKPSGRNMPSRFVSYEPLVYMLYGAYLHADFGVAMELMRVVASDPRLSDMNIAPQALYYWLGTIRKHFEGETARQVEVKAISSSVAVVNAPVASESGISSFQKLQSLYEKCQGNADDHVTRQREDPDKHGETWEIPNRKYVTIVYTVPYASPGTTDPSQEKCSVIADVVAGSGSPFDDFLEEFQGDHDELKASALHFASDESRESFAGIPEMIERTIQSTERKNPRSAYEEWIYTEYIGALSNFPWATSMDRATDGPSFLSGLRKMLSTAKFLVSKDYTINTRIVFYMLRLVRNHTVRMYQVGRGMSTDRMDANYAAYAREMYRNLEEILQLIAVHQSATHFLCCDKIRHEIYFCLDFFEWLDKRIDRKHNVRSLRTALECKWQVMTKKTGKIFHRRPGVVIHHLACTDRKHVEKVSVMPTCDISLKDLSVQRKQWEKYQKDLWGCEPESPPAPRRSERITSFLSFSREDKALCKLGQKISSPRSQSSF